MIVHIYRFGQEALHVETNRITMLEDGSAFQVPGKVLVIGTVTVHNRDISQTTTEKMTVIPMTDIEWFWIGDN